MDNKKPLLALALLCAAGLTQAGEKEELLKLRNTTTNLIKQLVKQGVITDKTAQDMIKQAEADADQQVADAKAASGKSAAAKEVVPADEVRVAYVPDFVKDDIRQQVRSELREEVVGDVMAKAKNEQWGLPNALPEWTRKFKLSGDLRLRSQNDFMAKDNIGPSLFYPNAMNINDAGGFSQTNPDDAYFNTLEDRHRFRQRLRIGIDAKIGEGLNAGVRLATGNQRDPVSTNQTLGNTGQRYDFTVDRAFLKYEAIDDDKFNWLTLSGGRIKNPWATGGDEFTAGSELVWDTDLSFEGFAATTRYRFNGEDKLTSTESAPVVFATLGAFPLQEFEFSSKDKWLFGGQVGLDWGFASQDSLKFNVAYFDYQNIQALPNKISPNTTVNGNCGLNSRDNTASRPEFMQGGNTLAAICTSQTGGTDFGMYGLASDFNILNINGSYDIALFSPTHVKFSADFAKNVGFDEKDVRAARFLSGNSSVEEQTNAWQARVDVGWPKVDKAGHWNVFAAYKHVERDAVLDAYTDSDFHLGGTNAKGWFMGGNYGLMNGVWLTGRWLSADVITGPPYGVDLLQVDVNTRF